MKLFLVILFTSLVSLPAIAKDFQIFVPANGKMLTLQELVGEIRTSPILVFGELHYTDPIQKAQAKVMESVIRADRSPFTYGWEFLDQEDQSKIDAAVADLHEKTLSPLNFLIRFQKSTNAKSYVPLISVAQKYLGGIQGLNIQRAKKSLVTKGGLSALDPAEIPQGFEMGGEHYWKRFEAVMGGHATPEQIKNYFEAQCLTDDVMAVNVLRAPTQRVFVTAGAFHTDYRDGMVDRLAQRNPTTAITVIRFADQKSLGDQTLEDFMHDPVYGQIADYVILTN